MLDLSTYSLPDACIKYGQVTGEQITEGYLINLALNGKIKLLVLYDGAIQRDSEDIIDFYGWLVPLPRFYAELIANGSCNVNMLTNFAEDTMFTLLEGVSKSITISSNNLFVTDTTLNYLAGIRPVDNFNNGRRANQIAFILEFIQSKDWSAHDLPYAAKSEIKKYCIESNQKLFTGSGFDHAWKDGLKSGHFKTQGHDKYSGKSKH